MGRKTRVAYYGAIYHIKVKGIDVLFRDDDDKITFLGIVEDVKEMMDYKLLAYCLLDSQYDLVIKTHNLPMNKIMQRINMRYTKYFNDKYKRKGSPYDGRYKGLLIEDENSLLSTIKYVHDLPVQLKIVNSMDNYKWSSDFFYRINMESIVDIEYMLDMLHNERYSSIEKYKTLMISPEGEYEFLKGFYEKDTYSKKEISPKLDEILKEICENEADFNLIKSGSKKSYLMNYKKEYILEAKRLGHSDVEIGRNISISERAVRKQKSSGQ